MLDLRKIAMLLASFMAEVLKKKEAIWVQREAPDPAVVERLVRELKAPREIAGILAQRGIDTEAKVKAFFSPKITDLHDPFLMRDMDKAMERIDQAISQKEKVMVFGDYDVDGTTSVSLVYQFFSEYLEDLSFYIPDRYKEGYGVSRQAIDLAAQEGRSLIIALDCGIRSIELVDYAKNKGVDFIICDHHLPGNEIPKAVAVLDPKRSDCEYPYKELCGCGIGFKLCQAYCQKHDLDEKLALRYLDLVCLAIGSDIVPITGENRVLAYFGLKIINSQPSLGLRKLIQKALKKEELGIGDLVFYVGPRINAAGRMDDATAAVRLLTSKDETEAEELAETLHQLNSDRREVDVKITNDLQEIIAQQPDLLMRKSLVFYDPDWHKGVIGIAASRAIELYYRPTIILTLSNGVLSGSGRSVNGFDLHEALHECREHLIQFGGHKYAAGLTMLKENLEAFKEAFEKYAQSQLRDEDLVPKMYYDAELSVEEVNDTLLNTVQRMAPFGPGNQKPIFFAKNLKDDGSSKIIGSTEEHARITVARSSESLPGVAFGMAAKLDDIKKADSFEACFQIEENVFRGQRNLQLMYKAIRTTSDIGSNDA